MIVYGTTEGHTAKIAERMAAAIRDGGHEVELHEAKDMRRALIPAGFDGIIVGGSVHAGDHQSSVREFAKRNREKLGNMPSAFFSVSLTSADSDAEAEAESQGLVEKFIVETGWRPAQTERIAGALVYTQYNIFVRHLMKLIAKSHGRAELDTSRDFDFTDWDAVDRFARDFAARTAGTTVTAR